MVSRGVQGDSSLFKSRQRPRRIFPRGLQWRLCVSVRATMQRTSGNALGLFTRRDRRRLKAGRRATSLGTFSRACTVHLQWRPPDRFRGAFFHFLFEARQLRALRDKRWWLRKKARAHGDCKVRKVDSAWTPSRPLRPQ